jgi:hypothetical protein
MTISVQRLISAIFVIAMSASDLVQAQNAAVTIGISVTANRIPISPLIYGISMETSSTDLSTMGAKSNRWGGNDTSRYNWKLNATNFNAGFWFESASYSSTTQGAQVDNLIQQTLAAKAQPMITVPMIEWIANLGANRAPLASFSTAKYGPQCAVLPSFVVAGDGIEPDCVTFVTGNNPSDANVPNTPTTQLAWVQHLVSKWRGAANGGVGYYILDNEPSDWYETQRDVHPVGPHATEANSLVLQFASMIHSADPAAKVVAPEEWGWTALMYSGYDQQYNETHGYCCYPDQVNEMNNMYYYPWLLTQWKAAGHPVDVVSTHYYPSSGEYSDDVSTSMQLLRNRSTRELWDPHYRSESWIGTKIDLIHVLQGWVNTYYYSGTPIGITEYSWGADDYINGATAEADILGIFGVQGVYMANHWMTLASTTPTFKAIQMYTNYDGKGSGFGDVSVKASVPNADNLSAFAAQNSKTGALTVMVISKVLSGSTPITMLLGGFTHTGTAAAYQLTAANAITKLPAVSWSGSKLSTTVPPQSITLFVLPQ